MDKNKLKKTVLAGMLGAALLTAMPVYAAENEPKKEEKNVTVNYTQVSTYTLSIPASIDLSASSAETEAIGVSEVNIEPGKKLQIKIKSGITEKHQVELARESDSNTKVVSDVTDSSKKPVSNGDVVAEFQNMSTAPIAGAGTNVLNFSAVADSAGGTVKAGKYSGTIVFEAVIVDVPAAADGE